MTVRSIIGLLVLFHTVALAASQKSAIKIFWHIYAKDHWASIVRDQLTKIVFTGLYDHVNEINCFIAGPEETDVDAASALISLWGNKFILRARGVGDATYERFTLSQIRPLLSSTDKLLYLHNKGVTHPMAGATHQVGSNIYFWRTYMEYYLLRHHMRCIALLDEYDTVGVDLFEPGGNIYTGNFWWSRADFFLLHPVSIGLGYYDPEHYLLDQPGINMSRIHSLAQSDMVKAMQSGENGAHYRESYPPKQYIDEGLQ